MTQEQRVLSEKKAPWFSESSQLAPATTFPSEVKANLNLVTELELLFIFANSFWHLLSKHIKMPVKIFAALLNLSGRLNWGEKWEHMDHKTYNSQLSHHPARNDLFEVAKWMPFIMEEIILQEGEKISLGTIIPCVSLVGSVCIPSLNSYAIV